MKPEQVKSVLGMLKLVFHLEELNESDLVNAANLCWDDFEDAVQSVTAERIKADYIITRNVRDFKNSKVTAFTPTEYLARR